MGGSREALRGVVGDQLVDAPAPFCVLHEEGGQLVEARLSGGHIPQYLAWLAQRSQLALRTLVLDQTTMRDWTPMAAQVARIYAPALTTLVLGGPAGAGARLLTLRALPAAVLARLEHLSIQARFLTPLTMLAPATKLRTLALDFEPKVEPIDLTPLTALVASLAGLEEVAVFGPMDAEQQRALFTAIPEQVHDAELDALGGERLARMSPARAAWRQAMDTEPDAGAWWESDAPAGTRIVSSAFGDGVLHRTELPNTRGLGRETHLGPGRRVDKQLWYGRAQGIHVSQQNGTSYIGRWERGVPQSGETRDADGTVVERRIFEDGTVVRTEKAGAAAPKKNSNPLLGDFTGSSNDGIEVLDIWPYGGPDDVPPNVAKLLVERFGEHADGPSMAAVWALSDDGFVRHRCRLWTTEAGLDVVTAHFGDTLVGIVIQEGKLVATVNDCFMEPVR